MITSPVGPRRFPALLLLPLLLALAWAPQQAFGHAKLKRSAPKGNSSSERPPKLVELWFTEEMQEGFTTVEVTDAKGRRVDRGPVTLSEGRTKAQVELGDLEPGAYTVAWKILSKDQHTIRGKFRFKVAAPAPTPTPREAAPTPQQPAQPPQGGSAQPPPAPESPSGETPGPDDAAAGGAEESPITWVDSLVRWFAYLAMMTLFGGFASRLFVLGPALGNGGPEPLAASDRRATLLLRSSVLVLGAALVVSLALQGMAVFGVGFGEALSPSRVAELLTKTGYGASWLLAAGAGSALAALILFSGARGLSRGSWLWAGLALSAALLVAPSLTGHAAASAGQHGLAAFSDWLHLVAGGFWVGGLFHLALCAPRGLARLPAAERAGALARLIARFTRVAVPGVVVVLLAGLYNAWLQVGSLGGLWGTAYGRTLLVKVLLVLLMLALGGLNNFYYGRRAAALVGGESGEEAARRGFLRAVGLEAALGVLVLLVTAALVFQTPARDYPGGAGGMATGPGVSRAP